MKIRLLIRGIACSGLLLLAGCGGGGTGTTESKNTMHESQSCIDCHDKTAVSPGTGQPIVTEWTASTHNTMNGASCADCHGSGYMHPASCAGCHTVGGQVVNPIMNPDAEGKCAKCHDSTKGFSTTRDYDGIVRNTLTEHFSTPTLKAYTSGSFNARYVTRNYENSCRSCHNPHDTGTAMEKSRQWARSGKGDVTANPWKSRDFRLSGTPLPATPATTFGNECVRCHTATGYITYLKDKTIAAYGSTSKVEGREVLACNACHDDGAGYAYGYKIRSVGQVTAYYNLSTTQAGPTRYRIRISETYDNIGTSNICLACHVGREIGEIIKQAAAQNLNFGATGFISSHYLTGGASIFQSGGYEFPGRNYPQGTGVAGSFLHRNVGVNNQNNTGSDGPCITCHLKPGRHSFLPVTLTDLVPPATSFWTRQVISIVSPECAKCHDGAIAPVKDATTLNASKNGFFQALEVLRLMMQAQGMYYRQGSIFSAAAGLARVSNWVKFGAGSGPNTMGAAFNYVLLNFDYGAYAHNSFYAKRLLYDSVDMLNNGILDDDSCATFNTNAATYPLAFQYMCNSNAANARP